MQAAYSFDATPREKMGKGASRALRRDKQVPVIVYVKGKESQSFSVDENALTIAYKKGSFTSKLVELKGKGGTFFAIPRELGIHPVSDRIEHADFQQVDETSEIKVKVPVHVQNVEKSIGIKRGGVLNVVRHDIEMMCKVNNIPKAIDIDISELNIGSSVHVDDITLPQGATPVIKRNFTIITIAGRAKEEEAAAAAPTGPAAPVPATKAKEPAAAAGGEAKPAAKK